MNKFDGKIAVITGGSSGIGLATAQRFVDEGAYVFITSGSSCIGQATAQRFVAEEAHIFSSLITVKVNSMQQSSRSAKTTTTSPVFRVTSQTSQILTGCMPG